MLSSEPVVVNYVSAHPGTGKTRAAVELMRLHIIKGHLGKNVGYIFYVAPTVDLLRQTISNLERELKHKDHLCDKIHAVASTGNKYNTGNYKDNVRKYTEFRVQQILRGIPSGKEEAVPFVHGCVLFLTHATFLKLQTHPKFKHTTVIFDESRKWVTSPTVLALTPAVKKIFDQLFTTTPVKVRGVAYEYIHRLTARTDLRPNQTAKLVETHAQGEEYKSLRRLWSQLLPRKGHPVRMQVFIFPKGQGDKKKIVQITLPSNPFVGFKNVLVLSAAFTSSEMYHLMRMEGCTLVDKTQTFLDRYLGEDEHSRAKGIMLQRNACLHISPLLYHDQPPSKNKLDTGFILPKERTEELLKKLDDLKLDSKDLATILSHLRGDIGGRLKPPQKKLLQFMQGIGCHTDILKWQVEQAQVLAKEWMSKREPTGPGLIFVNKDYTDALEDVDFNIFRSVSTGKAEGRNDFQAANVVCFLAAINPEPDMARLLNALLKHQGYDSDEDFVVDKAIQCIGRGNIRSHREEDRIKKMLAIVPSQWLAERIYRRLSDIPTVRYEDLAKLGNYAIWDGNKKLTAAEKAGADSAEALNHKKQLGKIRLDRHLKNPVNKKLASLRVHMHRLKKKEPTDAVLKKSLEIQAEIDELVAQRDSK
jgi:hypothetical protein